MSSSPTLESTPLPTSEPRTRAEGFIDRQLGRAAAQVRVFDLLGHVLTWCASVLAFLLALAVIDAWILPLGATARWGALLTLVLGSVAYLGWKVAPPLLRRINPMYAARMLEESRPELKNGLVNVLSLREQPELVRRRVMDLIAERTATDLSQIPIEAAIDRTYVIRIGYVLVALVAIAGAYKIFSPKDPLATLTRIAAPAADVPPPSRVDIVEVLPGDATVRFGEALEIVAHVEGLGRDETAMLHYSTDDGRAIDEPLSLVWDETSQRFQGSLITDRSGIERPLSYHVVAGDARSPEYRVEIQPRPTSTVDRVTVRPPKYTELPERTITGGDLSGPEGTEVTLFGAISVPARKVTLELLAPSSRVDGKEDRQRSAARKIDATLVDRQFEVRFRLEMDEERKLPKYDSYRIQLLTEDNQVDPDPSHYRIETTPDIAPEIRWLAPRSTEVSLPVDGRLDLETDAVDRDWHISKVTLQINRDQARLSTIELLDASRSRDDRHLGKYRLIPADIGAKPGDVLTLIAIAEDDRHHPLTDRPEPNTAQTPELTVRIEAPRSGREGGGSSQNGQGNGQAGGGDGQSASDGNEGESSEGSGGAGGQTGESSQGESGESGGGGAGGQNQNDAPMASGEQETSPMGGGAGGGGAAGEGQESDNPSQGSGANSPASEADGSSRDGASGGSDAGGAAEGGEGNTAEAGGTPSSGDSPEGAGNSGSNPAQNRADSGAGSENNSDSEPTADSAMPQAGEGQSGEGQGGNRPPAKHEGEAFERLLERLERERGQQPNEGGSSSPQNQNAGTPSGNDNRPQDPNSPSNPMADSASGENVNNPSNNGNNNPSSTNPTGNPNSPTSSEQNPSSDPMEGMGSPSGQPESSNSDNPSTSSEPTPERGSGETSSSENNSGENRSGAEQGDASRSGSRNSDSQGNNASTSDRSSDPSGDTTSDSQENSGSNADSQNADGTGSPQNPSESNSGDPSNTSDMSEGSEGNPPSDRSPENQSDSSGAAQGSPSGSNPGQRNPASDSATNPAEDAASGEGDASPQTGSPANESDSSSTSGSPANEGGAPEGSPDQNASRSTDGSSRSATARPGESNPRSSGPREDVELADGDPANLEYARQATDLVLEYLKDQKESPDPELLEELGWSEEQLRTFLERWEAMRDAAAKGSATDRQRLDDRLRSLGLMPRSSGATRVRRSQDQLGGLAQDGDRTSPPAEYAEKFRQFLRGASQADSGRNDSPER